MKIKDLTLVYILTKYVKYDIFGRDLLTVYLNATVVSTRVKVNLSRGDVFVMSTAKLTNAKLLMSNYKSQF